jgi:hypothetical protein
MPGFGRTWYQSSATTATDLATLATGRARFVGRPLVCGALLVRRAATLAGDLALLLRRHGCEPASFLASFFHGLSPCSGPPTHAPDSDVDHRRMGNPQTSPSSQA